MVSLWCQIQSKSLVGDSSIIFSPPSIVAETLHDDTVFESKKSSVGLWNSKFQVAVRRCLYTMKRAVRCFVFA